MQQAMLPEKLEEVTIKDMLEGESYYTVPWAMWANKKGYLWLNGNYPFYQEEAGTARMKITKINGGFEVNVSQCKDEKWTSKENTAWDANRLPVVKLV